MTSLFKKFFGGRIKRLNYFSALLTLSLFFGLFNFGCGYLLSRSVITKNTNSNLTSIGKKGEINIDKGVIEKLFKDVDNSLKPYSIPLLVVSVIATLLMFSLSFRRLHDFNMSGLMSLVGLLPILNKNLMIIGLLFSLVLLFKKGDLVKNKFGNIDKEKDIFKVIFPRN